MAEGASWQEVPTGIKEGDVALTGGIDVGERLARLGEVDSPLDENDPGQFTRIPGPGLLPLPMLVAGVALPLRPSDVGARVVRHLEEVILQLADLPAAEEEV